LGEPALDITTSSTPSFSDFDPSVIPYQDQVVDDVLCQYDYSLGVHEILLSGSVGSAKSILMAHLAVRHCLENPGAIVIVGRNAMPDLKRTIFKTIVDHLAGSFVRGRDYWIKENTAEITLSNTSMIISTSWADRDYKKVRSINASMAIFEELTENDEGDKQAYIEIKFRVGRIPHIKQNYIISATNPDSPAHWAYDYFELQKDEGQLATAQDRSPTKHVYYSVTTDNPFLPRWYVEQLKRDLDPKMAQRMIYGRWIDIQSEGVYHAYDRSTNYVDADYVVDPAHPIICTWDFNIGEGKPLSVAVGQYIKSRDEFHWFGEVVVEGMRTLDSCDELAGRGYLDHPTSYIIAGDASGKHKDTRNKKSDYEIIESFFSNYITASGQKLRFEKQVSLANPPVRTRHNTVNAYCRNEAGETRFFVYKGAPTVDKGMRLTALKSGGQYLEDDSKPYQHITTAVGYAVVTVPRRAAIKPQGTVEL
jgi:hypothetical protein